MALRQFPLLGIDRNGNKHPLFHSGYNMGRAADGVLEKHTDYVAVADGNQIPRKNSWYGKVIRARELGSEKTEGLLGGSSLGSAIAKAQQEDDRAKLMDRMDVAMMVIKRIERDGWTLVCVDGEESTEVRAVFTGPETDSKPTLSEADIHDIAEHKEPIIHALRERPRPEPPAPKKRARKTPKPSADQSKAPAPAENPDESMGIEIDKMGSVLSEVPQEQNFPLYDIELALRRHALHAIADDPQKLDRFVEQAIALEWIYRVPGREGVYRISKAEKPTQTSLLPAVPVTPAASPEILPAAQPVQIAPRLEAPSPAPQGAMQRLLENLVSSALAPETEEFSTADRIEAALRECQNSVLEAFDKCERSVRPLVKQLRDKDQISAALRRKILT